MEKTKTFVKKDFRIQQQSKYFSNDVHDGITPQCIKQRTQNMQQLETMANVRCEHCSQQ
jgi:hypothetical protein